MVLKPSASRRPVILKAGELLENLIEVVRLFGQEYAKQKAEQNLLDYSDLAHYAYKLLQNKEVIEDLNNTYKYIFVDMEFSTLNGDIIETNYMETNYIKDNIDTLKDMGFEIEEFGVKYPVYPQSFMQVNSEVKSKLYQEVLKDSL